jgi:putative DNA primase/helicase
MPLLGSPEYSEDAIALAFVDRHKDDLRFVPKWGQWVRWDGGVWREDTTLTAFDLAREVVREHALELARSASNHPNAPQKLASAKTVAAVEKLARADQHLARDTDIWDRDPCLMNTVGGVVDLRSGIMGPHDRDLHMTKVTAFAPEGDCPLWRNFSNRSPSATTISSHICSASPAMP